MEKQKTIEEYNVLRAALTLLVVIGHSTYYHIETPYGGCDYSALAKHMNVIYKISGCW